MMVAPDARSSVTLLNMWIEFADRYVPAGNCTIPPPDAALAATIVRLIAAVSLVLPSPVAPKSRTLNVVAADALGATASARPPTASASSVLIVFFARRGFMTRSPRSCGSQPQINDGDARASCAAAATRRESGVYIGCMGASSNTKVVVACARITQTALVNTGRRRLAMWYRAMRKIRFVRRPCQSFAGSTMFRVRAHCPHRVDGQWAPVPHRPVADYAMLTRKMRSEPSGAPPLLSQLVVLNHNWSAPGTFVTVRSLPYVPT